MTNEIINRKMNGPFIPMLIKLLGRKVMILIYLSIPTGILIGFLEFILGAAFINFFVAYELVQPSAGEAVLEILSDFDPLLTLIIAALTVAIMRFASQLLPNIATEFFQFRVRSAIVESCLPGAVEHSSLSVSDVSSILANYAPRSSSFVNSISSLFVSFFLTLTIVIGLILLSWKLTLFCGGLALLVGLPLAYEHKGRQKLSEAVAHHIGFFTERIIKDVRHLHFLKVSGANVSEHLLLQQTNQSAFDAYYAWLLRFLASSNMPPLIAIIFAIGLVYVNFTYSIVSLAILVPFLYLLTRLAGAFSTLFSALATIQSVLPYVRSFGQYVGQLFSDTNNSSIEGGIDVTEPTRLHVKSLSIGRDSPLTEELSFSVGQGETLVVGGPSGRGKTTLLMTIIGLVPRLDGSIHWNGISFNEIDPSKFRAHVGYAGPDPFLFDGSIRDNLMFGGSDDIDDIRINNALKCACAEEFVYALTGGLDHKLQENGTGISAGQQQRLSIARSLLRNPSILLMDEATANIDETTEKLIMENIRQIHPDLIMVAISHRSSMRQFATEFLEL